MFPVTDVHFVFGGFAAVAATVGYRFARKRATSTPAEALDRFALLVSTFSYTAG
jgi:hypothetical protein